MKRLLLIIAFGGLLSVGLLAQADSSSFSQKLAKYKIKASVALQLWSTYTHGHEVFGTEGGQYQPVDNRINTQLRRSRFSLKGQPYENLFFNLTAALDVVGRDLLAATEAGANNGSAPRFRLWNAVARWRVLPKKELFHFTIGYMVLQIGRESITSAMRSTSMEKSWSQNYLRRHLTGIGPGRASGLNLGGLLSGSNSSVHFGYDIGLFNPVFEAFNGNSTGINASPLSVGRFILYVGEPESSTYSLSHKINYFGQRNGLSLALAVARQGKTDLFENNGAFGGDVLFNYGPINLDGEYLLLRRTSLDQGRTPRLYSSAKTGYLRFSYNIDLATSFILEPTASYTFFQGAMLANEQAQVAATNGFAGKDVTFDLGTNLYFNPDLKVSLHYTWRWGDLGEGMPGATFNNYFNQPGVGAIRRGNWLGVGLVGIF